MQGYTKAYGWSSTKNHVGMWFINPTIEYLSGGPTRLDLECAGLAVAVNGQR